MEKYCISVDWLSVCCYGALIQEGELQGKSMTYEVKVTSRETALFRHFVEVRFRNLVIAEIQQDPRSSVLKRGLTILKLSNRTLYCTEYIAILYELMELLHLSYQGITRLDLCLDCNRFADGSDPSQFINDYVMIPESEVGGIIRKGSSKFTCHGSKTSKASKITSISFGSPSADVRSYIYNKTIELKEVKDKPWIRDMWAQNGLTNTDENPVWRSEISIKGEGKDLLNMDTGELFRLSPQYLEHYENIAKLFVFYSEKFLYFQRNGGQKNRRNFARIRLYHPNFTPTCKPRRLNRAADTGRMERICANKLIKLSETYVDMAESLRDSTSSAIEFLNVLGSFKALRHRQEAYKRYLDVFKASRFLRKDFPMMPDEFVYMEAVDAARQKKMVFDPQLAYELLIQPEECKEQLIPYELYESLNLPPAATDVNRIFR